MNDPLDGLLDMDSLPELPAMPASPPHQSPLKRLRTADKLKQESSGHAGEAASAASRMQMLETDVNELLGNLDRPSLDGLGPTIRGAVTPWLQQRKDGIRESKERSLERTRESLNEALASLEGHHGYALSLDSLRINQQGRITREGGAKAGQRLMALPPVPCGAIHNGSFAAEQPELKAEHIHPAAPHVRLVFRQEGGNLAIKEDGVYASCDIDPEEELCYGPFPDLTEPCSSNMVKALGSIRRWKMEPGTSREVTHGSQVEALQAAMASSLGCRLDQLDFEIPFCVCVGEREQQDIPSAERLGLFSLDQMQAGQVVMERNSQLVRAATQQSVARSVSKGPWRYVALRACDRMH